MGVPDQELHAKGRRGRDGIVVIVRPVWRQSIRVLHTSPTKRWVVISIGELYVIGTYFAPSVPNDEIGDMLEKCHELGVDFQRAIWCGDFNARSLKALMMLESLQRVRPIRGKWTTVSAKGRGIPDIAMVSSQSVIPAVRLYVDQSESVGGSDHRPLRLHVLLGKLAQPGPARNYLAALLIRYGAAHGMLVDFVIRATLSLEPQTHRQRTELASQLYAIFLHWVETAASKTIGVVTPKLGTSTSDAESGDELKEAQAALEAASLELSDPALTGSGRQRCFQKFVEARHHVREVAQPDQRPVFQKLVSGMKRSCALPEDIRRTGDGHSRPSDRRRRSKHRRRRPTATPAPADGGKANGKTPGPDGVFIEMLKKGGAGCASMLATLFVVFREWRTMPAVWQEANVVLIYKQKGDAAMAANYRPISLTCVVRRLYEKFVLAEQTTAIDNALEIQQGGFRRKMATTHQVYALDTIMKNESDLYVAFLDIKAAYDSVNRKILWQLLQNIPGVNDRFVANMRVLFEHNRARLCLHGRQSRDIRCRRGLLQGSSISPILFNIFINNLIWRLNFEETLQVGDLRTNSLFFADDAAIIGRDARVTQRLLNVCTEWGDQVGIEFAAAKCEIITAAPHVPLTIQRGEIPYSATFKYLGVEFDPTGIVWGAVAEKRLAAAEAMAQWLQSKGMNAGGWRLSTSVLAYKTFLRPMVEYGTALAATQELIDALNKFQNNVLRRILSCRQSVSIVAMQKTTGCWPAQVRVKKMEAGFCWSLEKSEIDSCARRLWRSANIEDAIKESANNKNDIWNQWQRTGVRGGAATLAYARRVFEIEDSKNRGNVGDEVALCPSGRPCDTAVELGDFSQDDHRLLTSWRLQW